MDEKFLYFDNPRNVIYACLGILLLVGFINIYSASFIYATEVHGSPFHFVWRYAFFAGLSIFSALAVRRIGYKYFLQGNTLLIMGGLVFFALVFVLLTKDGGNDVKRWIYFGSFSVQPSEFAKLFIILFCSSLLGRNINRGRAANFFYKPAFVSLTLGAVLGFLVAKEPDAGTGLIIGGLAFFLVFISGLRWVQVLLSLGVGAGILVLAIYLSPYRMDRLQVWLNPWSDPTGAGYQTVQSLIAVGSGKFVGMEWGSGTAKYFFLPELHTDFAFAIFAQENGFLGVMLLIGVFLLLGYAILTIMRRCNDSSGTLLAAGVIMLIVGQSFLNMAMVCGLIPISGVPLIFISYGGSSMFISFVSIGLVLSVYDRECILAKKARVQVQESAEERRSGWQLIDGGRAK